jgi:glycine betaine/choline ABC-type transport system substrate-binding protein
MQEGMADVSEEPKEYYAIVSKTFANEDDGYQQFYNRYALEKEFSVRRSYC